MELVSPDGFEPSAIGLKVRCSTAELWAPDGGHLVLPEGASDYKRSRVPEIGACGAGPWARKSARMSERRRSTRVEVHLTARYSSDAVSLAGVVSSLSRAGMFLRTDYLD